MGHFGREFKLLNKEFEQHQTLLYFNVILLVQIGEWLAFPLVIIMQSSLWLAFSQRSVYHCVPQEETLAGSKCPYPK